MVSDLLNDAEIQALLELFESEGIPEDILEQGELEARRKAGTGPVSELDLLKPNRFTRKQLDIIERLMEMIGRRIGGTVSERLRVDAQCDCVAVEQVRYSSWVGHVESPSGVYVVDLQPLALPGVLTISGDLLYGIVDRILGGEGTVSTEARELSETEYSVAESIVMPIIETVAEGISELVPVEGRLAGQYTNIAMANPLPLHEVVVATHFQVVGAPLMGDMRWVIPYSGIEPYLDELSKARFVAAANRAGEFRGVLETTVSAVPLELSVELGRTQMPLADLMGLDVGDVVRLDTRIGQLLACTVQGQNKFQGQLGARGPRFAVRITEGAG